MHWGPRCGNLRETHQFVGCHAEAACPTYGLTYREHEMNE